MELHQLRYVLAVVETGSFTAAAERVRVSQSGVSTQVQKLERELGVALFDRTSRRVALTQEGERLMPAIRAALEAIGEIGATAADLRGLLLGSLRVGTVFGLTWPRFYDALAEISAAHPGLELRLREDTSAQLVGAVRRGEIDLALVAWAEHAPDGLGSVVVFDDPMVAVVAPSHPWAARRRISPDELVGMDLIALPEGTGDRAALDALLSGRPGAGAPHWEVSTPSAVEKLAVRGLGVGVVSAATCRRWEGIRAIPIDAPEVRSRLGVVWRATPTRAARALLELLHPDE
ncbi:LysR family transcriptional regulator [Microbacterium sp. 13-71-7]|jgi:DNA-binding transcriptional LysR family regulator|uniref:LysR family transcriptional regulator n=1 Tax=Microbacterium sp. 13-71-7 TaxID=1970399 RepID=UPI000BD9D895|nr:LysR family transcriptional regulator [Microbacterium sp. 13-71-7]OZB81821.1 MAG: LysR family transcriptional regulator [Microbacterium sp. 13-71-7]